jgi:hypothetical protein
VPPSWLARVGTRLRNWLGRGHAKMVPPFALAMERTLGMIDNKMLSVAVELGIPDLLAAGPRSAAELAAAAGADADALNRMLRFLVSRDVLGVTSDGRYQNNDVSNRLRKDHPWPWRDWVLFFGSEWHWQIWQHAKHAILTGKSATVAATGHSFFEYVNRVNPEAAAAFNGAMAAGSRLQGLLVIESYDFSRVKHLCDVGGGTGSILADVLAAHPDLRGTVLDLPELAAEARALFAARGVGERAEFVGGSFFESVPGGCDLYTLYAIVHDWDDEACLKILGTIRRAMNDGARLLVTEATIPADAHYSYPKVMDLEMLILTGSGRERSHAELLALFARAGLKLRREVPLPSLFTVFELVPI